MGKERKWILKEPADPEKVGRLSAELGIDRVLADLLVKRGVETFEQARSFFRPSLNDLHDPFLMKDMDVAVERVRKAITTEEKILVYGDYDVDGTTAVSLVYSFLRRYSSKVDFYIPDRYDEGYGVSYKGIDWAGDNGFGLIITLDCGIKANEKVEYAATKGIDVIICDHHLPENTLPPAVAVLDPKREDDTYPFDEWLRGGIQACAGIFTEIWDSVRDFDSAVGSSGGQHRGGPRDDGGGEQGSRALRTQAVE